MKSKHRKTICIELICISLLSVLPIGGSSQHFDSGAQKYDRNHVRGSSRNEPTTLSVPIQDVSDYHAESVHARHKRAAPGNKFLKLFSLNNNLVLITSMIKF